MDERTRMLSSLKRDMSHEFQNCFVLETGRDDGTDRGQVNAHRTMFVTARPYASNMVGRDPQS